MYYYQNGAAVPYMQQQAQFNGLKGRPVSSLEEVRAAQIDFDGSLFIFPDLAHNRIYTKQISMDGSASLNVYELAQLPTTTEQIETKDFVTRKEFEDVVTQLKDAFNQPKESNTELPQINF